MIPDLPYERPANVLPFPIARTMCGWCCGRGEIPVPDGTQWPAMALCGVCNGRGYVLTEQPCD